MTAPDVRPRVKKTGDTPELGDTLGHPMTGHGRWGRIVGIRKGEDVRAIEQFIVRKYRPGDDAFPTGEYCTTWLIVPWCGHEDEGLG